jgi:hypothetical protein
MSSRILVAADLCCRSIFTRLLIVSAELSAVFCNQGEIWHRNAHTSHIKCFKYGGQSVQCTERELVFFAKSRNRFAKKIKNIVYFLRKRLNYGDVFCIGLLRLRMKEDFLHQDLSRFSSSRHVVQGTVGLQQ